MTRRRSGILKIGAVDRDELPLVVAIVQPEDGHAPGGRPHLAHVRRPCRCRHLAVERDDAPRAFHETVVAEARRPGAGAEILEIARATRFVFVVAGNSARAPAVPSPCRLEAVPKVFHASRHVRVVAGGKYRPWNSIE